MGSEERREKYTAAICAAEGIEWELVKASYPIDVPSYHRDADAAMAVADEEIVEAMRHMYDDRERENARLRAENARLRAALTATQRRSRLDREELAVLHAENKRLTAELSAVREAAEAADLYMVCEALGIDW